MEKAYQGVQDDQPPMQSIYCACKLYVLLCKKLTNKQNGSVCDFRPVNLIALYYNL